MTEARNKIRRWIREGVSFRLIKDRINALPASEEEKSALWLWAWSFTRNRESQHGEHRHGLLAD